MQPMMPPPYPMYPPPRGGGFARGILMTLATTLFGLSLTLNVYLLIVSGLTGGASAKATNLLEGDPMQKIAVIPLKGLIADQASTKFAKLLSEIEKDNGVKALVVEIDSPGGTVTASDEIHHRLMKFKADHQGMPVVVSMAGLAASGGYYVACAGEYVFAQPTTLTGNIGVLMPQFNVSELFEKYGVKETTIESTGADFKNAGSMFRPENPKDRAYIQDIADKAFGQFKSVVSAGRQGKLKKPLPEIANGKIYVANDALTLGLIDQVGYLQDACDHAAKKAGLNRPTIVDYQEKPGLVESIMAGKSNLGSTSTESVTVNGVNIDASAIRELTSPRLMYLWRGR